MFLGGAGLADTMLYCRDKIYPLGLPNGISHVLTALAVLVRMVLGLKASFLPPDPQPLQVSLRERPASHGPLLAAGGDHAREAAAVGRARRRAAGAR